MKKVLIITYYWPPSGGSGVQRWLKFVKYLRNFGWEPVVYTPENPEIPAYDESLLKDIPDNLTVIKTPIWEPYSFYKTFIGQKQDSRINAGFLSENKKPKLSEKISVWIRGNFFIPDARKFWIKPSIHFLKTYLSKNPVDAIISSGPPHSMHMIALGLKKKLNIPWIADFRDPWTNIDFYEDLMLTSWADAKHRKLEKEVVKWSDCLLVIGNSMKEEFIEIGAKHVEVIHNGFDPEDLLDAAVKLDTKFSLAHIGTMVRTRNPELLWRVLSKLVKNDVQFANDLELKLVGKVDFSVSNSLKEHGLMHNVKRIDYMPHNEVIQYQRSSQILLLLINQTKNAKGILTGKFFEYLSAQRPILAIGPVDGDAAHILHETQAGKISGFDDEEQLNQNILNFYTLYKQNKLTCDSTQVGNYARNNLTKKLTGLLNIVAKK